jgi:hypothetical protein
MLFTYIALEIFNWFLLMILSKETDADAGV